tara:strand:- start:19848 stop:19985 length:138 start_codon:yes stop_codon:yes gene_type:complete
MADTVVTEFGVAELLGTTMYESARALLGIAHPEYRPKLERAFRKV